MFFDRQVSCASDSALAQNNGFWLLSGVVMWSRSRYGVLGYRVAGMSFEDPQSCRHSVRGFFSAATSETRIPVYDEDAISKG
jgi:hypothetical protein